VTRAARVQAQAKLNLTLLVGERDASGYHDLFTVFQRIALADEVVVRAGGRARSLDCAGPRLPAAGLGPVETNLAWRAATAYAERAGWPDGFAIELTKHIPTGGGLGGGSADAGAVLRALDRLAPTPLGPATLMDVAATLGADVAFLASDFVLATGTGRGEQLAGAAPLPVRAVALVVPDFPVATAEAYRWLDEDRARGLEIAGHTLARPSAPDGWESVAMRAANHFQSVVERRHPELGVYRQRLLEAGASLAMLAGSGSTVFGVFDGAAPTADDLRVDALVLPTQTSARVVQVEVLE